MGEALPFGFLDNDTRGIVRAGLCQATRFSPRDTMELLYDQLEIEADKTVLAAAVRAGWSSEDVTKGSMSRGLKDSLSVLGNAP